MQKGSDGNEVEQMKTTAKKMICTNTGRKSARKRGQRRPVHKGAGQEKYSTLKDELRLGCG